MEKAKKEEKEVLPILSEWLVVILIVFALIFEQILHRFEHWMNRKHQHLQSVAKVMYRELMILGVVSFMFIMYQFIAGPEKKIVFTFEFAHIFIFLLAVFYATVVLSTMFISLRLSARWKHMEQLDLVRYLHLKEEYQRLRIRMHRHHGRTWRMFRWWFPNFGTLFRYRDLHEIMTFHDIRFQFIFYRRLPEHFRFSSFLRKIKSLTFIALVESHWTVLLIFLGFVLLDILRRTVTGANTVSNDDVESSFLVGAAILIAIAVQILAIKIRKIYWELTKHPRVYYEGVEPLAVAEELAAAEGRLEADRTRRRQSVPEARDDLGAVADDEATDGAKENAAERDTAISPSSLKKPLALLGSPDPNKASPLVSDPAADPTLSEDRLSLSRGVDQVNRRSESNSGRLNFTRGTNNTSDNPSVADNSLTAHAQRYADNKRSRSSLSEHPGPASKDTSIPIEEIASRHSLEFTRAPVTAPPRVLESNSSSSVALAVAAARRRSIEVQARGSVDSRADPERRAIGAPRIMSRFSSKGASVEDESRLSRSDYRRSSLDSKGRARRRGSIELMAAMPHDEIVERHRNQPYLEDDHDLESGRPSSTVMSSEVDDASRFHPQSDDVTGSVVKEKVEQDGDGYAMNAFMRHRSLGFLNATILKNLEQQQKAQNMEPAHYPRVVKKVIPRLGRVASPVEKLFWFGSHKFFLWMIELTLYFSTVLTAAATAGLALKVSTKEPLSTVTIVSFILPPIALVFVLMRIAGIITKYIFILHNASLVPEAVAIEAIHKVSEKQNSLNRDDNSDISGDETEREDAETARERRRNLGRFFRSEAAAGNVIGIDSAHEATAEELHGAANRRANKRRISLQLRKKRLSDDYPTQSAHTSIDAETLATAGAV